MTITWYLRRLTVVAVVYRDSFQIQLSHQTYFYMGQAPNSTNPKGNIDNDFQVAINLKWEKCDPSIDKVSNWGRGYEVSPGWSPYTKHK